MSSVSQLYWRIFHGEEKLSVFVATRENYERLRVALCKYHRKAKDCLAANDRDSVCADFDLEKGTATFWIGEKRSQKKLEFTIIESEAANEEMSGTVESHIKIIGASESEVEGLTGQEEFYSFGTTGKK